MSLGAQDNLFITLGGVGRGTQNLAAISVGETRLNMDSGEHNLWQSIWKMIFPKGLPIISY